MGSCRRSSVGGKAGAKEEANESPESAVLALVGWAQG